MGLIDAVHEMILCSIGTIEIVFHGSNPLMNLPKSHGADTVVGDLAKYMLLTIAPGPRSRGEVSMESQIIQKPGLRGCAVSLNHLTHI